MTISVENITKRFGTFTALDNISLEAKPGEFLALLGPSGSGKTTLLRIMAGLEFPDSGTVAFDGVDVSDRPTRERAVGFVFQHYALFRLMTIHDNVAFGLSVKPRSERPPASEIRRTVRELLELVQLGHVADRYPSQLSGGQRQRVALARALAVRPRILLLDEPFGALDAKVRKELRRWLRTIHNEMGLTSVFVTHDQEEALELADRVVVMNNARIEQIDTPEALYNDPATAFVCDFLGNANRFDCTFERGGVRIAGAAFPLPAGRSNDGTGVAFIRPHEFELQPAGHGCGLEAQIVRTSRLGAMTAIECRTADGATIDVIHPDQLPAWLRPGAAATLTPSRIRAYAA